MKVIGTERRGTALKHRETSPRRTTTTRRRIGLLSGAFLLLLLLAACGTASSAPPPTPRPTSRAAPTTATPPPKVSAQSTATPAAPRATPTPTPVRREIDLETPLSGATISTPVEVRGRVSVTPFEATLSGRVYDAQGRLVGQGPIHVDGEMGKPGTFTGQVAFTAGNGGPGRVEVADISAKDGSVIASATVGVVLAAEKASTAPQKPSGVVEVPAPGARSTLPLHVLARVGQPGEQLISVLRWQDGAELSRTSTALRGEDGRGLLVDNLDWSSESQRPQPPTQPATLEIRSRSGAVLARQALTMLASDDPDVQEVQVYWVLGESLQAQQRHIPRTPRIAAAALEELLWGPTPGNLAGFTTALPTPEQVLRFPGREPDWGPRVTLRRVVIENGVATADFSKELKAYGGGSVRVMLLRQQITRTLKQFSTVREVRIAIEGQTEAVLEP